MKIINLILFSNNNIYLKMKKILDSYLIIYSNINKNFMFLYYCYDPNINSEYLIKNNILFFKGKETFNPGITTKTIKAIKFIQDNFEYDYIVRSNISTVINFSELFRFLEKNIVLYGGHVKNKMDYKKRWCYKKIKRY